MLNCLTLVIITFLSFEALSHGDAPPITSHSYQTNSANQKIHFSKTGKEFEIVLTIDFSKTPNTTLFVNNPITNEPSTEIEATLNLIHSDESSGDKYIFDSNDNKGVYNTSIHQEDYKHLKLTVSNKNSKEEFDFDINGLIQSNTSIIASLPLYSVFFVILLTFIGVTLFQRKRFAKLFRLTPIFFCFICTDVLAHGGDDHLHDEESTSAEERSSIDNTDEIINLPQGIYVPKNIQFSLAIRTEKTTKKPLEGTVQLTGRIISDPVGYARLQATQQSKIISSSEYPLPIPGQKINKDDVILVLQPTLGRTETTEQKTVLYKAESEITQLQKQVDRLEKLGQFSAQKDLDNAKAELERALKQKEEILNKNFKPDYLKAPLSGVLSDLHVRPGEVVEPSKTIVEIIDPEKILVEALVFSPGVAEQINSGYAKIPQDSKQTMRLLLLGVSPKVDQHDQSIHVIFKPEKFNPVFKLDMAVEVIGELKDKQETLSIPKSAIIEDHKGTWVYVQTSPELFEPRKIKLGRSTNTMVEISDGLEEGERLVIEGSYLIHHAK